MSKEKTKEKKLKRLYKQLLKHSQQNISNTAETIVEDSIGKSITIVATSLTRRGRLELAIQTLEKTGKKKKK
jgi:phage gp46-like protein